MSIFRSVKALIGGVVEKKSASLTDPAILEIFGSVPTASGVSVTASNALRVPAVLQAVRLISETVGSLPCKLYSDSDGDKEAAKTHPGYKLVHDRANEWTSAGHLRAELTADALLHGAGYAVVDRASDGRPIFLRRLPPGTVQRQFEDSGEPFYLVTDKNRKQVRLSFRDVLYLPAFGGVSPVTLGKEAIGLALILERHGSQFFGSGARPSGIVWNEKPVIADNDHGATVTGRILKSFRRWKESANGDPLILDGGWKFDQPAMTSTDAQFLENRLEQVREIARVFGVPPHMLFELSRATWSNAEQMGATFLQLCLRPWLDRWQDAYTTCLLTEDEQETLYPEFVIDDLQRADAAGRAEIFGKLVAMRAMTPNEVRAAMNLPAMPGGDELSNPYITTTTTGPATAPKKDTP
ncbi:phage portal protein [Manganibacter manganicus]|uniref:phage portal protein n=1 Tax=Manganibacter manganicus TaxID=1873176 RepID=UPI002477E1BF|nr:phage portal protein [Pseudaminobacter manganicus]